MVNFMTEDKYLKLVKENTLKENTLKNTFISFLSGGVLGLMAEALTNIYMKILYLEESSALTLMTITFIFISSENIKSVFIN